MYNDCSNIVAELYQGGCPAPDDDLSDFEVIVNCSHDLAEGTGRRPYEPPPTSVYLELKLRDSNPDDYGGTMWVRAKRMADLLAGLVDRGGKVLVHCTQGWNRSGLVVALTLMELGMAPDAAIDRVQTRRHPMALSNPYFTAHLRRLGPSVAADLARTERSW